jgi:hypothetical protein
MSADQWGALSVVVERAFDTPTEVCAGISRMRYLPYGASISGGGRRGHQDLHAGGTGDPWRGRDSIRVSNGVPRWGIPTNTQKGTNLRKNGAGDGTRTRDLLITNQLLYQLSYAGLEA